MATPDLAALQAQVVKLQKDYTDLTNKPAALFDVGNIDNAERAIKTLTDQIELAREKASRLEEGFGGIFDEVTAIVAELYKTQQPIDLASKAMKGIRNVTEKLKYDQQGISEMSLKELKNSKKKLESLQEQVITQAKQIRVDEGLAQYSGDQLNNLLKQSVSLGLMTKEKAAIIRGEAEGFKVFTKQNEKLVERIKLEEKVQSGLGITGGLLKGISKIPIIGDMFDASDVVEEMEAHLREVDKDGKQINSNTSALKVGLANVGKQIIDGLLNPANLIVGVFTLMVEALKGADKGAGDLAKGFNMTYNEAMGVREELTQIGNLSGDAALNTRALQESMMAIGKSLGSNAMASERDLIAMAKLREQAGFTNDEILGIEKTSLATGKNLDENVSSLLHAAKVTGLNNKVLLNEKDIMRDVAKASDAIKLSLGGSGEKLGAAAAQAKALGMSLSQVDKIAGSLLDFESSINNELSAELITGKDLNLEQARLYALTNDTEGLSRELAKNFGTAAEFNKMNRIQQEAIAKAVGMEREELATTLTDQEALKGLSGDKLKDAQAALDYARAQGMTEKQIANTSYENLSKQQGVQERLTMAVEKMKEIFVSIAEPIMAIISPIVNGLMPVLSVISGIVGFIAGKFGTMLKYISPIVVAIASFYAISKTIVAVQKTLIFLQGAYNLLMGRSLTIEQRRGIILAKNFLKSMFGYAISAGEAVAKIPFVGPALAIVAIASAAAIGYGMYAKMMGDGNFPAAGKGPDRTITSKGTMYKPAADDNIYVTPQKMVAVGDMSSRGNGRANNYTSAKNQYPQQPPSPVYVTVNPTTPISGISQIQNQYYTIA